VVGAQVTGAVALRALTIASEWVWSLTGRQYGVSRVAVVVGPPPPVRVQRGGRTLRSSGVRGDRMRLWHHPVATVDEVVVDGEALDPDTDWSLNRGWLIRANGLLWPAGDLDDPDAFRVVYQYGSAPPASLVAAVEMLAGQVALALGDSSDCQLHPGVRSIVRQGLTIDMTAEPGVGVPMIDDLLARENPAGGMGPVRVARFGTWVDHISTVEANVPAPDPVEP
jgi:hypothetical protein